MPKLWIGINGTVEPWLIGSRIFHVCFDFTSWFRLIFRSNSFAYTEWFVELYLSFFHLKTLLPTQKALIMQKFVSIFQTKMRRQSYKLIGFFLRHHFCLHSKIIDIDEFLFWSLTLPVFWIIKVIWSVVGLSFCVKIRMVFEILFSMFALDVKQVFWLFLDLILSLYKLLWMRFIWSIFSYRTVRFLNSLHYLITWL